MNFVMRIKNLHIFLDFIFQKNIRMDILTQILCYIVYHSSLKSSIKEKIKKQWPVAHLRNVTTTNQQVTGTSRCVFKSMLNDGSIVTCLSNPSFNKLSLCKIHYDTYQFVYFTYKLIQKEFEFVNNSEENCLFVIFLRILHSKLFFNDTMDEGHARFTLKLTKFILSPLDFSYIFNTPIYNDYFLKELETFIVSNFFRKMNMLTGCAVISFKRGGSRFRLKYSREMVLSRIFQNHQHLRPLAVLL